jgi:hypothetical protein
LRLQIVPLLAAAMRNDASVLGLILNTGDAASAGCLTSRPQHEGGNGVWIDFHKEQKENIGLVDQTLRDRNDAFQPAT